MWHIFAGVLPQCQARCSSPNSPLPIAIPGPCLSIRAINYRPSYGVLVRAGRWLVHATENKLLYSVTANELVVLLDTLLMRTNCRTLWM